MADPNSIERTPSYGRHISLATSELRAGQAYQLLTQLVVPRPIALVSTIDPAGRTNLAPFSFFMLGGSNPPSLAISTVTRAQSAGLSHRKDTLQNILQTEEFVVHGLDYPLLGSANQASADYPSEISEWDQLPLTAVPSLVVRPPRALQSPWALECKLHQWVRHGSEPGSANYLIGEVLVFHVREDLVRDRHQLRLSAWDWVARLDGNGYVREQAEHRMELDRPKL